MYLESTLVLLSCDHLFAMTDRLLAHSSILNVRQAGVAVVAANILNILEGDGRDEAF